jgi:hypothetical protein
MTDTVWTSIIVPLLPTDVVTGAIVEHVTLAVTGLATVILAVAAWAGR